MQKAILIVAFVLIFNILFIPFLLNTVGFIGFGKFHYVSELRLYEHDFLIFDNQELCFDASSISNVTILDSTFPGTCIDSSLLPTGIFDVVI